MAYKNISKEITLLFKKRKKSLFKVEKITSRLKIYKHFIVKIYNDSNKNTSNCKEFINYYNFTLIFFIQINNYDKIINLS